MAIDPFTLDESLDTLYGRPLRPTSGRFSIRYSEVYSGFLFRTSITYLWFSEIPDLSAKGVAKFSLYSGEPFFGLVAPKVLKT